jgi:hypothetical protein
MKNKILLVFMAMTMVFAMAVAAQAQIIIDLEIAPIQTGASVSFLGNNLVGFNLVIDKITGINTPLHAGNADALTSNNGLWNFTAPKLTATPPDHWLFQNDLGSTSLAVTGDFTNATTLGSVTDPVPFIAASWISAEVHKIVGSANSYAVTGVFTDFKSLDLLNYFGVPNDKMTATFTFGITLPFGIVPPDQFTSLTVQSGDITQTPIPGSLLLLGSGLLGLVGLRVRRS